MRLLALTEFYTFIPENFLKYSSYTCDYNRSEFTSTSGSKIITVNFPSAHGFQAGDIVKFESVTGITGSGNSAYTDATFEGIKYMVTSIVDSDQITITAAANSAGTNLASTGSATALCYEHVGPAQELGGYGWGTALWGGTAIGPATTTLATALTNTTTTDIVLANSAAFPNAGEIRIGSERTLALLTTTLQQIL